MYSRLIRKKEAQRHLKKTVLYYLKTDVRIGPRLKKNQFFVCLFVLNGVRIKQS